MADMTVAQLRAMLEDFEDDMPVRMAVQPSWPLQHGIRHEVYAVQGVVYLAEGGLPYDANPYAPRAAWDGEADAERCTACERPLGDDSPLDETDPIDCAECGRTAN